MKIVTILGARPQFIKAASLSREVRAQRKNGLNVKEVIVHTGQHFDANMSDIFFDEMNIPQPDYSLGVAGKSHGVMTGEMIAKIEEVLTEERPDWVLLYGDTNSTLAGAIAASKLNFPIAHVEAGLRSRNIAMPEEINRIVTDRLSSILFCPTSLAMNNLKLEGIDNWSHVIDYKLSGDVMLDGVKYYRNLARKPLHVDVDKDFVLCTIHRAENTNNADRLISIFEALRKIGREKQIILSLHPRTKAYIEKLNIDTSELTLISPVGYLNMIWLLDNCSVVITDSGGLQKEAYFLARPCITLRDETEWQELVEIGANTLVGSNRDKIWEAFSSANYKVTFRGSLYGDGNASKFILDSLVTNSESSLRKS